jgi:uncharacterized protein YjbJ (UPF0337 family)
MLYVFPVGAAFSSRRLFGSPPAGCWRAARSHIKEAFMNWDQLEGKWKQYSGKLKEKWGKLTDDDLTTINGKRDQLVGKLQERYGMAKDQAESQIDEFTRRLSDVDREAHKTRGA